MNDNIRRLPILSAAFILASALTGAGCSSEADTLDVGSAMSEIESELAGRFDIRAEDLDCPEEIEVEDGAVFDCAGADQRGRRFTLAVELIGKQGRFTFAKPEFERDE